MAPWRGTKGQPPALMQLQRASLMIGQGAEVLPLPQQRYYHKRQLGGFWVSLARPEAALGRAQLRVQWTGQLLVVVERQQGVGWELPWALDPCLSHRKSGTRNAAPP